MGASLNPFAACLIVPTSAQGNSSIRSEKHRPGTQNAPLITRMCQLDVYRLQIYYCIDICKRYDDFPLRVWRKLWLTFQLRATVVTLMWFLRSVKLDGWGSGNLREVISHHVRVQVKKRVWWTVMILLLLINLTIIVHYSNGVRMFNPFLWNLWPKFSFCGISLSYIENPIKIFCHISINDWFILVTSYFTKWSQTRNYQTSFLKKKSISLRP